MTKLTKELIESIHGTPEEIEQEARSRRGTCKLDACNWWPQLQEAGVRIPETIFVPMTYDELVSIFKVFDGKQMGKLGRVYISKIKKAIKEIGPPCFLRNSISSDKHNWEKTCFIDEDSNILHQIIALIEYSTQCPYGHPTAFMIRKLIDTKHEFYAFRGNMPITKERRYFVNNGKVSCHHPYWPPLAIKDHTDDKQWAIKIELMNIESDEEVKYLTEQTEKVGKLFEGYWSVDWLQDKNGEWWCIDMAEGWCSYHWPDCDKEIIKE